MLNLIGTFVFAVSGALLADGKQYDIVGMAVLAEITAIGGALQQLGSSGSIGPFVATPDFYDPSGRVLRFFPFIGVLLFLTGTLVAMARTAPSWVGKPRHSTDAVLKQIQPWKR